jgi:hypothetical protein
MAIATWLGFVFALLCISTCTSSAPAPSAPVTSLPATSAPFGSMSRAQPRGFWDRLSDHLTERECFVHRFTCPYGFGPAGEPCECTEPGGLVRKGTTIK